MPVTSTKTFKSTKSTAMIETRASKKTAAAAAKAGPKTTGLDDDDDDGFSL